MRRILLVFATVCCPSFVAAHGYSSGDLEILHPAITVPEERADCTCAHAQIVNHGPSTEYFVGVEIQAASRTHLIQVNADSLGLGTPARIAIDPGATLDLHRREWCLFMSGIKARLDADYGSIPGVLHFEGRAPVKVEFMIDAARP
jgi:hypothetical protein